MCSLTVRPVAAAVLELDTHNANAYFNRGSTHDSLGSYDKAIADYTRALEIDREMAASNPGGGAPGPSSIGTTLLVMSSNAVVGCRVCRVCVCVCVSLGVVCRGVSWTASGVMCGACVCATLTYYHPAAGVAVPFVARARVKTPIPRLRHHRGRVSLCVQRPWPSLLSRPSSRASRTACRP